MDPLILALLLYLKTNGIEPADPTDVHPIIHQKLSADDITKVVGGSVVGACLNGHIYLRDDVNLETIDGKSVLLHELDHYVQDIDPRTKVHCPPLKRDDPKFYLNEELAYNIQNQYLRDNGSGKHVINPYASSYETLEPNGYIPPASKMLPHCYGSCKNIQEDPAATRKRFEASEQKNKKNWHSRFENDNMFK